MDYSDSDESDFDDFQDDLDDESCTIQCPNCAAEVYEDAEQCPHCGEYIVHSTSVWANRPWWWVVLGLAGIVAVIFALSLVGAIG